MKLNLGESLWSQEATQEIGQQTGAPEGAMEEKQEVTGWRSGRNVGAWKIPWQWSSGWNPVIEKVIFSSVCFFPVCLLSCSHRAFHFWHFGHQMCGGFSPQQEASLHDTRWVSHNLNNSDTICPEMASDSRVRVQSYKIICPIPYHTHTHTHTHWMPVESQSCHLGFWPPSCRLEVLTIPSLGLITLLEQLTESRKRVYLTLTSLLSKNMIKDIGEHIDGGATCGKLGGKCVCIIRVLSGYHSPSSKTCSPTQKLPGTCALGILWRLHHRGMISRQLYLQPFSFLKRRGSGAALLLPRKWQGFQGLCARNWGQRQMYIFPLFHKHITLEYTKSFQEAHRYLFKKYLFWLCGVLVVACEFF